MVPYFFLVVPIYFLGFLNLTKEFNNKRFTGFIMNFYMIFLILFSGLRLNTGYDFFSYQRIFMSSHLRSYTSLSIEPGYLALNKIILKYFNNYNILLLIVSLISIVCIVNFIKKYSPNRIISLYFYVIIYFIGGITGQMRQAVAISILTLSFKYIEERKFIKFLSIVSIATMFHFTSLVIIAFYFLYPMKITKKKIISISVISMIFGIINVFRFIITVIDKVSNFILVEAVVNYSESRHAFNLLLSAGYMERLLMISLILLFYEDLVKKYQHSKLFIVGYLINTWIYFVFTNYSIFARRLSSPFKIVDVILIVMLIAVQKNKGIRLLAFMVFSVLFLAGMYATITSSSGHYIPYEFIKLL